MRIRLIAVSRPIEGGDPRRLIVLAVKTSAGKVKEKGAEYYLKHYPDEKLNEWLLQAAEKFPSVLEHVVMTFLIEGCSRVCTHQLVRHRIASYTQESQRYSVIENPENLMELHDRVAEMLADNDIRGAEQELNRFFTIPPLRFEERWRYLNWLNESLFQYASLIMSGVPYEDARFVLPQAVKSRIMVTVNLRELLHIACLRLSPHAQWEIREAVKGMLDEVWEKLSIPVWEMRERFCRAGTQ